MVARMRRSGEIRVVLRSSLGCGAVAERLDGFFLAAINLKHRKQFCNLQQVANTLCQSRQFDRAAAVSRRDVQGDQSSQAAAINVGNVSQIQYNAATLRNQSSDSVPQLGGFFAKNNTSGAIRNYDSVVKGPNSNFQLHG
jgi:hypothetical protein